MLGYVRFTEKGYNYLDSNGHLLFSEEDNNHELLFDFGVNKNFSSISSLLEKYFNRKIDADDEGSDSLKIKGSSNDESEIDEIRYIMTSAHPYYEYNCKEIISKAIGNYLNGTLYQFYYDRRQWLSHGIKKETYLQILEFMLPKSQRNYFDGLDSDSLYSELCKNLPIYATYAYPNLHALGLHNETKYQNAIANMLYYVLSRDSNELKDLTPRQRLWLFSSINDVPETISKAGHMYKLYDDEYDDFSFDFARLNDLNALTEDIPKGLKKALNAAAMQVRSDDNSDVYKVNSIFDLLYLEAMRMYENGDMITKCKNCGEYFSTRSNKVVYCNRVTKTGKTCAEIGPSNSFMKKQETDEVLQMYIRAYKRNFARCTNGKMDKAKFKEWHNKATEKLLQARSGQLSPEEFELWLKK